MKENTHNDTVHAWGRLNEYAHDPGELVRFILLLLDSMDSVPIPSRTHMHNEIYLLQKIFPDLADYTDYSLSMVGQESKAVEHELSELESAGLVRSMSDSLEITPIGSALLKNLRNRTSTRELEKIAEFKKLLNDLTEEEVVFFACFSASPGPDAEKKPWYRNLAEKRKRLAMSMYKKNKTSAQKAAELSGENFEDFFAELKSVS